MKLKLVLATSTALGLIFATGAYAGSGNNALVIQGNLDQSSTGNQLSITQTAANNSTVGLSVPIPSGGPDTSIPAYMAGSNDTLFVTQSGTSDAVGDHHASATGYNILLAPINATPSSWDGVTQNGYDQYLHVNQTGTNDDVGVVNQTGWDTGLGYGNENEVNVNQTANNNTVKAIVQDYKGDGSTTGTGSSGYLYPKNVADVEQSGTGNNVNEIYQLGGGNTADLNMTGSSNGVGTFIPFSIAGLFSGADNSALIGALPASLGSYVALYGLAPNGTVQQIGHDNELSVAISGTSDKFGFRSSGDYDRINGTLGGSGNAVAVQQLLGNYNTAALDVLGGNNNVGIAQGGNGNTATADTLGTASNNNIALIQAGIGTGLNTATAKVTDGSHDTLIGIQVANVGNNTSDVELSNGSYNLVATAQVSNGGNNVANVNGAGTGNIAAVVQYSNGAGTNTANVHLNGSGNNVLANIYPLTASRDAQWQNHTIGENLVTGGTIGNEVNTLLGQIPALGPTLLGADILSPGLMTQVGADNNLTMTVASNFNLFSTFQDGNGNTINASIGGAGGNELAVAQRGNGNSLTSTQNGSMNSIGLTQYGSNSATINQ